MFEIKITDHRITDLHDPRRVTRAGTAEDADAAMDATENIARGFAGTINGARYRFANLADGPAWLVEDVNGYGSRTLATIQAKLVHA